MRPDDRQHEEPGEKASEEAQGTGARGVVTPELAARLAAASGLRNLVAHQYGVLDWSRIHEIATSNLGDLLEFCEALARAAEKR